MTSELSKALLKLATDYTPALTTESDYYTIGCIKVRFSDHMSNEMDCDLAVFCNGKSTYCLIPYIGTWKEVRWFTSIKEIISYITNFEYFARTFVKSFTPIHREVTPQMITEVEWEKKFKVYYNSKILSPYFPKLFQLYKDGKITMREMGEMSSMSKKKQVAKYKQLLGEN